MDQVEHETQLVKVFIRREKHDRLLRFLADPKKRHKATDTFYHPRDLQEEYLIQIKANEQDPEQVASLLRQYGASQKCWAISTNSEIDATELDLAYALSESIGSSEGTFLSCIPGKLAYFEGESPGFRFILHKP